MSQVIDTVEPVSETRRAALGMCAYGARSSFIPALGEALLKASEDDAMRIKRAFPDDWAIALGLYNERFEQERD